MISIELGQEVMWNGCLCVVDQIIEHEDGNHEIALAMNGRVYWDYGAMQPRTWVVTCII